MYQEHSSGDAPMMPLTTSQARMASIHSTLLAANCKGCGDAGETRGGWVQQIGHPLSWPAQLPPSWPASAVASRLFLFRPETRGKLGKAPTGIDAQLVLGLAARLGQGGRQLARPSCTHTDRNRNRHAGEQGRSAGARGERVVQQRAAAVAGRRRWARAGSREC